MFNATIHGYPASYSIDDGWRCNEAMVEKFLRTNCTPNVEPDETQVNLEAREALTIPADPLEHASLLAATEFFGAYQRVEHAA